jgi:hypothetical protein
VGDFAPAESEFLAVRLVDVNAQIRGLLMTTDGKTQVNTQQRKPYHAPVLHVYGGIEALTKSVSGTSGFDGANNMGSKTKTS